MGALLWEPYCGNLAMGTLLWEPCHGNLAMGTLLWEPCYGNLAMGTLVWQPWRVGRPKKTYSQTTEDVELDCCDPPVAVNGREGTEKRLIKN